MDEPEAELLIDLPEEPYELLELLQDIISTFREHYTGRFQNDSKETLVRKHLKSRLWQLDFHLEGYMNQQGPISQELYTAAHRVAVGLNSTIHARRIQDIIERDNENHYTTSPSPNVSRVKFGLAKLTFQNSER